MHVTGFYAALAALLVLFLAVRVILRRKSARIGIGTGGDHELARRVRAHANAVEYLPIGLILLLLVELNQARPLLVHVLGATLVGGRVLHAIGLSKNAGISPGRTLGMIFSLLAILAMAMLLLWQYTTAAMG